MPSVINDLGDLSEADRLAHALRSWAPVYVSGDDSLQLSVWNSLASVTVVCAGRFVGLDGFPRAFRHTIVPSTARAISSLILPLGEGWILNLEIYVTGAAPILGQTFARAQMLRGREGGTEAIGLLAAGYITAVQPLAWPGSSIGQTIDTVGALRSVTGTDPAAGVEISETVPTNAVWELIGFSYTLVTDATVLNRQSDVVIDDGTTTIVTSAAQALQTASLTRVYQRWSGFATPFADLGNRQLMPLPTPLRLGPGFRIRTSTPIIAGGDNYGAPQMLVREWLQGAA